MSKTKTTKERLLSNIYKHRRELNLSVAEFADRVGVTRASVSRYESDDDTFVFPKHETLDSIAEALEIDVSELFTDGKKAPNPNTSLDDALAVLNRHLADAGLKISRLKKDF